MLCSNCGREIPDNTRFCNYCGADQAIKTSQEPVYANVQPSKKIKPKKKKRNILVVIAAVLAASTLGQLAGKEMAKSNTKDTEPKGIVLDNTIDDDRKDTKQEEIPELEAIKKPEFETDTEPAAENVPEASAEFTQIFRDRSIVMMPALFLGLDSASFARVEDDGTIICYQFGYKDDVISEMVQTAYVDVSSLSESDREAMAASLKGNISEFENLDFVTTSSDLGTNYYSVSLRLERLDEEDILTQAKEKGMIQTTGNNGWMSMSVTKTGLLADGFVMK